MEVTKFRFAGRPSATPRAIIYGFHYPRKTEFALSTTLVVFCLFQKIKLHPDQFDPDTFLNLVS